MEKLAKFTEQRKLEANPLVRWCPKAGCDGHVIAKNFKASKLSCDKCKTKICFQCRSEWHGYFTSCNSVK